MYVSLVLIHDNFFISVRSCSSSDFTM